MRAQFPRINATVLAVFLLVSLPVLAGGVLLVLLAAQATLRDTNGLHLSHVAQQTAASVDAYIYRKVLDVSQIGRVPSVRDAVQQSAPTSADSLAANEASRFLADLVANDSVYREIVVTNRAGQTVAASRAVESQDFSRDDWWQATVDDGILGRVFVSGLRQAPDNGSTVMQVSAPVPGEADGGRLTGVVRVVFDTRELLAPVTGMQLGNTGMATLVHDNGTVLFSHRSTDPGARFFAARELAEVLERQAASPGATDDGLHFTAEGPEGEDYVVGAAQSQLTSSFPALSWFVAISQTETELMGPVQSIGWYLLLVFVVTVALVLLLALYFSVRLHEPPIDVDMHLVHHPRVSRMPDTGDEDEEDVAPETSRSGNTSSSRDSKSTLRV